MNNAEFIIKFLLKKKLKTAFGVTGGGAMFLNEAFRRQKNLNFVFMHHEQSAAMAAEAFTRITKKPAILSVTSGPGGTNAVTGVIGAWIDSIPMIIISGQVESKDMILNSKTRQIGIQEANITQIIESITKYSVVLSKDSDVELELSKAYKIANEGRPGPVWIDVPLDIQSKKFIKSKKVKIKPTKKNINKIKNNDISKSLEMIRASNRPLVLVGNGVHISSAEKKFLNFVRKSKIPFLSTWNASDLIQSNHPLYFGRPGLFGNRVANFAIQSCDLLIILGSRLSVPITGYQMKNFSPLSKKIFVDIDKKETIKRKLKTNLSIINDVGIFLNEINKKIKNINQQKIWVKKLQKLKLSLEEDNKYKKNKKYINSFRFINNLSKILTGKENIVTDMGTSFTCTMQSFKTKKNQRLFTSSGIAAMGFGLPGIIGAYFADKKKTPICITGDGGLMFNIQELHTLINYKIPVKLFIINNGGYLTMKLMQQKNFKKFVGADDNSGLTLPKFLKVAKSFGFKTKKLINENNLNQNLDKVMKSKHSVICEIITPPMQELVPRVQTQMNKNGSFEPAMLDNMYPFLGIEKVNKIREDLLNS
jgi:acetolactate synthase I/II/III large subunit